MSGIELAEKRCRKCGEMKPLTEFHRNRSNTDGRTGSCAKCETEMVKARAAERRAEMGEEAWLAHQAEIQRRHRQRTGGARDRRYNADRYKATQALIERHRSEFDHLLLLARRGELDTIGATP